MSLPGHRPLPVWGPRWGLAACRTAGAQREGKPSDLPSAIPSCRDALACQIFTALQQARAGQQYHQDSVGSSVDWPVSLPWLTYNTSDAGSLLEATDIQSRCRSLALDPQTLQVTATLELIAPQTGSWWAVAAATLLTHPCLGLLAKL